MARGEHSDTFNEVLLTILITSHTTATKPVLKRYSILYVHSDAGTCFGTAAGGPLIEGRRAPALAALAVLPTSLAEVRLDDDEAVTVDAEPETEGLGLPGPKTSMPAASFWPTCEAESSGPMRSLPALSGLPRLPPAADEGRRE